MKTIVHKANSRGEVSFGWLKSKHSFSFGHYHNPERINFGMLRVLNDDIVAGGAGFPTHPHNNMEIVSIPLAGALAHRDSTGTEKAIETGEVQIMSAGSGLTHSEYNHSKTEEVNFLQIWVIPKEKNITPRYDQRHFSIDDRRNKLQVVVAPNDEKALWINQDAWFSFADMDKSTSINYTINKEGNGVYLFVIDGELEVGGEQLSSRDAIGISEASTIDLVATSKAKVLLIEIPMN
jgi:quercetin 2,3-dioxygenase